MAKILRFPGRRPRQGPDAGTTRADVPSYNVGTMPIRTETISETGASFRLGDWLVEPSLNRVTRGATAVQLELKAMDVLVFLAGRAGEVVSRFELQDAVWQTEFVADNTLVKRIAQIREALGDDPRQPQFVETIPKRGYRLIAEVRLRRRVRRDRRCLP